MSFESTTKGLNIYLPTCTYASGTKRQRWYDEQEIEIETETEKECSKIKDNTETETKIYYLDR